MTWLLHVMLFFHPKQSINHVLYIKSLSRLSFLCALSYPNALGGGGRFRILGGPRGGQIPSTHMTS